MSRFPSISKASVKDANLHPYVNYYNALREDIQDDSDRRELNRLKRIING